MQLMASNTMLAEGETTLLCLTKLWNILFERTLKRADESHHKQH
jgi:uncharacterized cupredoxin-like copper-binding protein